MRILFALIVTAAIFCTASTASAVEFTLLGPTVVTTSSGETHTINILMTNVSGTALLGIGASVYNYGRNEFVGGQAVGSYLNQLCIRPGLCFGGLTNLVGPELEESSIGDNENRVQIALSESPFLVTNPGYETDPGLDDTVGTTMFSLTFTARVTALIRIGTGYHGDGVILGDGSSIEAQEATFEILIIPEPGTALLVGLGLTGLAADGPAPIERVRALLPTSPSKLARAFP